MKTSAAPIHLRLEVEKEVVVKRKPYNFNQMWHVFNVRSRVMGIVKWVSGLSWLAKWMIFGTMAFVLGGIIWVGYDLAVMSYPVIGEMASVAFCAFVSVAVLWGGTFATGLKHALDA